MTKTKSQIGKSANLKGKAFEREIAVKLREYFPGARRKLQYQALDNEPDVGHTDYYIECKRYAPTVSENQLCRWFEVAKEKSRLWVEEGNPERPVVLVFKADFKPIRVFTDRRMGVDDDQVYPTRIVWVAYHEITWDEFIETIKREVSK